MLIRALLGSLVLAASTSFAAPEERCRYEPQASGRPIRVCYQKVNEVRVLNNIQVEPTNGGFNPSFSAYVVSGNVEIAGNSCMAQGLQASLKQTQDGGGRTSITAHVTGWRRTDIGCTMIYDPVFAPVSLTVRGENNVAARTFILNAEEFGNTVPLEAYLP